MSREDDIKAKLEFAEVQRNKLMDEMFAAKKEKRSPKYIAQMAGEILGLVRECLDYCGADIVERRVSPKTNNKKVKQKIASGKQGRYFPFHESQIKNRDTPFHELKVIHPSLYADLVSLTELMGSNKTIPGTDFRYRWFIELKDMVNENKHDRLTAIVREDDRGILVDGKDLSALVVIRETTPGVRIEVSSESGFSAVVEEYRFASNDVEVGHFCLFAVQATRELLDELYKHLR